MIITRHILPDCRQWADGAKRMVDRQTRSRLKVPIDKQLYLVRLVAECDSRESDNERDDEDDNDDDGDETDDVLDIRVEETLL